jgi:lysophospholipase L1-like esterase
MILHQGPWLAKGETLALFGDSITADANGFSRLIANHLTGKGVKVIPAGFGGDNTPKALMRLQKDLLDKRPDAVSIFLGTNDAGCGRGRWADEPIMSPQGFRDNLTWMIYLCKLKGIKKFSITPPLWRCEGESWPEFGDIRAPFILAAREAAEEMDAWFVPADTAFADEWWGKPKYEGFFLTTDGVHLSERGNSLLAKTMLKAWNMDA